MAGSGLAAPVLEAVAAQQDVALDISVVGSNAGASTFCAGGTDIALLTRPLSPEEEAACNSNGIAFREYLLGHNVLSLVVNTADVLPQCLSSAALDAIFAPSATATEWPTVDGTDYNLPLSIFIPSSDSVAYALLDSAVTGIELRSDAAVNVLGGAAAMLEAVSATPGAIGVVTGSPDLGETLRAVQIDNGVSGCVDATVDNVERRTYQAANRLFAYVNEDAAESASALLEGAFSGTTLADLELAEYTAPSENALAQNQSILADALTGRQFSREVTEFAIPTSLVGEIGIAGATEAGTYLQALTTGFSTLYPGVLLNYTAEGLASGVQKFCNGEVDILATYAPLTEEQLATCSANNVTPEPYYMGSQVVVLATRAGAEYGVCLTTNEVATLWGATNEGVIENWSALRDGLPDLPVLLFSPSGGSINRDLLVLKADLGQPVAPRTDAQENNDPAYRAAAVANADGGVTFMSWQEFVNLPADEKSRIQALPVEGGEGCVEPSEATIADGTYALSRPVTLLVRRLAIGRQDVQSLLWYASSDENYALVTGADLVGLPFESLVERRSSLEALFTTAAEEAANAVLEELAATPEATSEATPESSGDATPEATGESSGG
ncbi:MAG: substrate-binding domain-containing protein [Chloroflexi bacterium]|nr:substrate-binding domain-containing protein [Chloroflexota bacterium]